MDSTVQKVDIIKDLLDAVVFNQPCSSFFLSLYRQYMEKGGLSKKQLDILYTASSRIDSIQAKKLASLEALMLNMPTRYKSPMPDFTPLYDRNEILGEKMDAILEKYPNHKRVLFLKCKFDNNEVLSTQELREIERFSVSLL